MKGLLCHRGRYPEKDTAEKLDIISKQERQQKKPNKIFAVFTKTASAMLYNIE
ncbi:MAG: hypothetical protein ACP5N0_07150 [Methanosarcina sp.]|jgi:hypothetical protein